MTYVDLKDLCSVKKTHFNIIFEDFFDKKKLLKWDIEANFVGSNFYKNYDVYKIHLKDTNNLDQLLYQLFEHIIVFSWEDYSLSEGNQKKYTESIKILIKYFDILKEKELEDLNKWVNMVPRATKNGTSYLIDKDIESLNKQRELWEIILFFLIESILESPLALSKVKLKTSGQMPVHWSDAIHINSNGETLLFWESKITNSLSNWIEQSRDSILKFLSKDPIFYISEEISVISRNIHSISPSKFDHVKSLINPYHNDEKEKNDFPFEIVCFLWYEDDIYKNYLADGDENKYMEWLYKKIEWLLVYYDGKNSELLNKKITFFLLPIPDIFNLLKLYAIKLRSDDNNTNILP